MERSTVLRADGRAQLLTTDVEKSEAERVLYLHRLNDTLARMPEPRRNMFLLSRIEQWTYYEIAAAYRVSTARVRREIRRAMFQLRRRTCPQDYSLWQRIKPVWMS